MGRCCRSDLEKSELDLSAVHHLGLIGFLGGLGICIQASASGNSHGNHWPQSISVFAQLRFPEQETAPDEDQSYPRALGCLLKVGHPESQGWNTGKGRPGCSPALGPWAWPCWAWLCCCLLSRHWALCSGSCWQPDVDTGSQRTDVICLGPHSYSVVKPGFEPTSANLKASVTITKGNMWHSLGSHLAHSGLFLCPFITDNEKKPNH